MSELLPLQKIQTFHPADVKTGNDAEESDVYLWYVRLGDIQQMWIVLIQYILELDEIVIRSPQPRSLKINHCNENKRSA